MEYVNKIEDIYELTDNKILGVPELINSKINFNGKNNIFVFEKNIRLLNSNIQFIGDNSIIYLSNTKHGTYTFNIIVRNDSAIFIGKNIDFSNSNLNIQEHQNLIIGDECVIGNRVTMRTCDTHPIYDFKSKRRINFSESIFIGDHVWIDHSAFISPGTKIGSGSVIGINSFIPKYTTIKSNCYAHGNPIEILNENIFFTHEFTGYCTMEDTFNHQKYEGDIIYYEYDENETLSLKNVDKIIKNLPVNERLEFIYKLLVKNKSKNRFYI